MYQIKDKVEAENTDKEAQEPMQVELPYKTADASNESSSHSKQSGIDEITEILVEKGHDVPPDEEVDELLHWSTQLDEDSIAI
jgi:hypothetical protein